MNFGKKMQEEKRKYSQVEIDDIINDCEKYRKKLILYCQKFFKYETEYAEDCVQEAYLALVENLQNGVQIQNYEAWLCKVVLNNKNKIIKDKIKRNEQDFDDSEIKATVMENESSYTPDFIDQMISDEMVEKAAIKIISQLDENEKQLYYEIYCKKRRLRDVAKELNISDNTIYLRNLRLKQKLESLIKNFEIYQKDF